MAVIELDSRDKQIGEPALYKITDAGEELILDGPAQEWGKFLRYNYLRFDFSSIREEGLYQVRYGESVSPVLPKTFMNVASGSRNWSTSCRSRCVICG